MAGRSVLISPRNTSKHGDTLPNEAASETSFDFDRVPTIVDSF